MQEKKFTNKKAFVQECTSKDLGEGTLQNLRLNYSKMDPWLHKKGGKE